MTRRLRVCIAIALLLPALSSLGREREKIVRYDESNPVVFARKGSWVVGGSASYSGHKNDNYAFTVVKGIKSVGYRLAASPEALYFIGDNFAVGGRFTYGRMMMDVDTASAKIGSIDMEFDNYYAISHDFTAMALLRYYIPVAESRKIAFHVDAGIFATYGQAEYSDEHTGAIVGTWEDRNKYGILVNPGLSAKLSPRFALFATVGMGGLTYSRREQKHNQVDTGTSTTFAFRYMLDLTSLSFGINVFLGKK